ncbi:cell envelope integrity protein TolA [Glaesserella parasuis]|uniref:cell envelope integrity protein TolA n=1 Tax=Glaesserella parasuis TaxID=738 RepID=UPI0003AC2439|nr:cell envelope integrity protein TolA [Glaesserella parasuis]EQA04199.1 protein TolA [Glaesserella parasuis str. Nagasaki]
MKYQNDRLELAIIVSVLLHLLLIGSLILGSFFTNTHLASAGGSGGDSESLEAVMVDTGQVAAEYGRLKAEKQGQAKVEPKEEPKEEVKEEVEDKPTPEEIAEQQEREKAIQLAQQKQQEEKRQQELARQEALKQEQIKQERLKKQQEEATQRKLAEAARLKAEAEAKRLEALAKQAEEERKIKEAEQQKRLEEQKKLKAEQQAQAKAQAEKEAKEKAEQEAKLKAEKEAKEKAEKEAKAKAEKEAKAKAAAEAKAKAEAAAKAEKAKNNKVLDDFLSGGEVGGGTSNGGNKNSAGSQGCSGGTKGLGQGANVDGNAYGQRIKKLIQSKYRVDPSFAGKQCDVKIFLERDGTITNYQVVSGDKAVCDAAVSAIVATRKVPPAPSDAVYQQYRSPTLDFSLKVQ